MPDLEETPGPPKLNPVRRLARPAVALAGVILFQLLFVSVFAGVLHHPVLHQAPVAVAGRSPLAQAVSSRGGGTVRLAAEPAASAARAALRGGQVNAAVIAGPTGETLLVQTAASPGTASVLTKEFTTAAAALGGYVGATTVALVLGGTRPPGLRQAGIRLGLLAGYAVISGLLGALLIGPVMGVVPGYSLSLAGTGMLLVFGDPTAGTGIATPLLASPWNVIGQGLPPSAALSAARGVVYLGGTNLTGPLAVLAAYAAAGTLLTLAATAWRPRHPAPRAPQHAAQVTGTTAAGSLATRPDG